AKGCKPVIEYAGLKATEEHNVWTNAGWKTLAECKEGGLAIAVAGIGGRPVRESDGHYRRDCLSRQSAALGSQMCELQTHNDAAILSLSDGEIGVSPLRVPREQS